MVLASFGQSGFSHPGPLIAGTIFFLKRTVLGPCDVRERDVRLAMHVPAGSQTVQIREYCNSLQ
jgi:hypothetical protein